MGGYVDPEILQVSMRTPSPGLGAWPAADGGLPDFDSLGSIFDDVPSAPFGAGWA